MFLLLLPLVLSALLEPGDAKIPPPFPATELTALQVSPSVTQILNDRTLWGKDFPTLLAFIDSWNRINEQRIYVFPDRVVGTTRHRTREEAQQASARLSEAMKAPRPQPKREFLELLRGVPAQPPDELRVEAVTFLPDDELPHVAWTSRTMRFLAENLSVATVRQRLGPPQRTTMELIQNETERRPVILTVHSYAGGAIAFAESDWGTPGQVDRVILDVRTVRAAIF